MGSICRRIVRVLADAITIMGQSRWQVTSYTHGWWPRGR
jgi:hypothetical protein